MTPYEVPIAAAGEGTYTTASAMPVAATTTTAPVARRDNARSHLPNWGTARPVSPTAHTRPPIHVPTASWCRAPTATSHAALPGRLVAWLTSALVTGRSTAVVASVAAAACAAGARQRTPAAIAATSAIVARASPTAPTVVP